MLSQYQRLKGNPPQPVCYTLTTNCIVLVLIKE